MTAHKSTHSVQAEGALRSLELSLRKQALLAPLHGTRQVIHGLGRCADNRRGWTLPEARALGAARAGMITCRWRMRRRGAPKDGGNLAREVIAHDAAHAPPLQLATQNPNDSSTSGNA